MAAREERLETAAVVAGARPSSATSRSTLARSSRRSTTRSPAAVGTIETRTSTSRPPTRSAMRPSCGSRRSAMSRPAMIFTRDTSAACMLSGGAGEAGRRDRSPALRCGQDHALHRNSRRGFHHHQRDRAPPRRQDDVLARQPRTRHGRPHCAGRRRPVPRRSLRAGRESRHRRRPGQSQTQVAKPMPSTTCERVAADRRRGERRTSRR